MQFFFLHATADDMHANTENAKAMHYLEAYFQVLTITNEPVANVIDGNVQLYVFSKLPDNFQCVAEMPKLSKVDLDTDISKETQLSSLGANNVEHRKCF